MNDSQPAQSFSGSSPSFDVLLHPPTHPTPPPPLSVWVIVWAVQAEGKVASLALVYEL